MKHNANKTVCLLIVILMMINMGGCSNQEQKGNEIGSSAQETPLPTVNPDVIEETLNEDAGILEETSNEDADSSEQTEATAVISLSSSQLRAINTLNYLTSLLQDIQDSKQNRIYLQEAFASLKDNTHPDIDTITQSYITDILNTLSNLRMLAVKREHLEYIYEQNKSHAIQSAIPNPLAVLNVVQSGSPIKTLASLVFMTVDSIGSYLSETASADLKYLEDGWDLDEQEVKQIDHSQINAFNYMVDIVRDADLHEDAALLAMNESSVKQFIEMKKTSNIYSRIQALKDNEKTYAGYGGYWLLLAQSYYELNQYENCLKAANSYEDLHMDIFRKDHDYANTIPLIISAASETMDVNEYIPFSERYLKRLMENCENGQWNLRYFASITYLDLYAKSQNDAYLQKAFDIAKNNVNYLIKEQLNNNTSYLKAVEKISTKNITEKNKKEAEQINKTRETKRRTELPPVYEPLWINCKLLFSLAQQFDVPENEKAEIEAILHGNEMPLFLIEALDNFCWFEKKELEGEASDAVMFNKGNLSVPVKYLSDDYEIVVQLIEENSMVEFDDWVVDKVERKTEGDIETFSAKLKSKKAASHKYANEGIATVNIYPKGSMEEFHFYADYQAVADGVFQIKLNTHFERVK